MGGTAIAANLPCGAWREHTRKFSPQWFLAVHATIPFVAMLRKAVLMPKWAILLTVAGASESLLRGGWLVLVKAAYCCFLLSDHCWHWLECLLRPLAVLTTPRCRRCSRTSCCCSRWPGCGSTHGAPAPAAAQQPGRGGRQQRQRIGARAGGRLPAVLAVCGGCPFMDAGPSSGEVGRQPPPLLSLYNVHIGSGQSRRGSTFCCKGSCAPFDCFLLLFWLDSYAAGPCTPLLLVKPSCHRAWMPVSLQISSVVVARASEGVKSGSRAAGLYNPMYSVDCNR